MDTIHMITLVCEAVILLPAVIGNSLILICIYKFKRLQTPMYILIGSLASSDLLTGAILNPFDLVGLTSNFYRDKHVCLFRLGTFVVLLGTSILSMLAISIERFVSLAFPLKHLKSKTMVCAKYFIPVSWSFTTVIGYMPLFGVNNYKSNATCKYTAQFTKEYIHFINMFYAICIFFNILFFILVIRITLVTIRRKRNLQCSSRVAKNLKKTYLIIIISALFVLCWGPFSLVSFIGLFYKWTTYDVTIRFCVIPGFLNSGFNWIIYGIANTRFRRALSILLRCQRGDLSNYSSSFTSQTLSIRHM